MAETISGSITTGVVLAGTMVISSAQDGVITVGNQVEGQIVGGPQGETGPQGPQGDSPVLAAGTGIAVDNTDPLAPGVALSAGAQASLALADTAVQDLSDLGITATATELNYTDGVTSAIQTQLDAKEASFSKGNLVAGTNVTLDGTLTNRLVGTGNVTINATGGGVSDWGDIGGTLSDQTDLQAALNAKQDTITGLTASGSELNILDGATLTTTELNYVDGVTSSIQTQLDTKADDTDLASYLPLAGGTMSGTLTSRQVAPSADSTYTLGTSSAYWSNTYTDRLYLNSTAYIDGGTSGAINAFGTVNIQHPSSSTFLYINAASGQNRASIQLTGKNASNDGDSLTISMRTDFADAMCYVYDVSAATFHNFFRFDYLNDILETPHNRPFADSTWDLGGTSRYWRNTYTDRLYLNSTAYLDGGTAGIINITGSLGPISSVAGSGTNNAMYINTGATGNRASINLRGYNASNSGDFFTTEMRTDTAEVVMYAYDASASSYIIFLNFSYLSGIATFAQNLAVGDAKNIALGSTTGTKIGTSTSQKLGFWNATPIVQPTTSAAAATFTANSGTAVNDASTFDGYTLKQVVKALRNIGLLA